MDDIQDGEELEKSKFLQDQSEYFHRYIAVADTKASWSFAISSAIVVYDLAQIKKWNDATPDIYFVMIWIAVGLLCFSGFLSFNVIYPRLGGDASGLVYFGSVAKRPDASKFSEEIHKTSLESLSAQRARHNFEVATICVAKFEAVQRASWFGIPGFVISALCIVGTAP